MEKKIKNIKDFIEDYVEKNSIKNNKYGEVFTNFKTINEMLLLLDDIFWENPKLKILDPCSGVGNFSILVIEKLMIGLSNFEKDENKRYEYIINNMIYCCEIQEKNVEIQKSLFNYNIYQGSFLSNDFDLFLKNEWNIDKFDLIVANPPYQVGNNSRSYVSIYDKFVEKFTKISKKCLVITPSRWYSNPSMEIFRKNMISNYGLKKLIDVKENIFKNVDIKGGISFFLLEEGYKGECLYNNSLKVFENNLITNNIVIDTFIKNNKSFNNFGSLLKSDQYFGIKNKDERFLKDKSIDTIKCYVSLKNGEIQYIKKELITIKDNFLKYKVFIPTASGSSNNIGLLGRLVIGYPEEVCSRSFVHIPFNSLQECKNFISYIETDFIKSLISLKKKTQLVKKECFSLVPIVPLDEEWDNDKVIHYFNDIKAQL